ncbi:MAG: DUF192 domain-containing protein [Candidatus Sericytochromatia bacterium]|nr:DUF192 domain-containing protein [Candidatus Sericytochromatia bacterium]
MSPAAALCLTLVRTGQPLALRARVADTAWQRLVGLLAGPPLAAAEGLLLIPCNAVHCFGMRYAIDVLYLSHLGEVLAMRHAMRPWQMDWPVRGAHAVLELPAGRLQQAGVQLGDRLSGLPFP